MQLLHECPATAEVTVAEFSPGISRAWDGWLGRQAEATPFHSTAWLRALQRAFGYESRSLYSERAGRITGVLPLFLVSNWMVGRCLLSSPFADYGGVCAEDDESADALVERAREMAIEERVEFLELRHRRPKPLAEFLRKDLYVGFSCELGSDPEGLLKKLPRDTRYMIRKAEKAALEVRSGVDQMSAFYQLLALSWHRFGTPVFSPQWLQILAEEFNGSMDLTLVYKQGYPLCGVFSLFSQDTAFPHYVGARPEAYQVAANNFVYWNLMKDAISRGLRRFDFGRSKRGTGAYEFKTSWNMQVDPLNYQILLVKRKDVPNFSPANPKFALASGLWRRMPLMATTWLGPRVVRWLP
jgi:FemAB-related protein (PEP-CTERM system-associated)